MDLFNQESFLQGVQQQVDRLHKTSKSQQVSLASANRIPKIAQASWPSQRTLGQVAKKTGVEGVPKFDKALVVQLSHKRQKSFCDWLLSREPGTIATKAHATEGQRYGGDTLQKLIGRTWKAPS